MRSISSYIKSHSTAKRAVVFLSAAVLAISMSGCLKKDPLEEAAVLVNAAATNPQTTQTADVLPAEGGQLNITMPENPSTLNPLKIKNAELSNIYRLIFESLVDIDTAGQPQPGLAETWETSEDGKT